MNMASFPDGTIDFIRSSVATLRRMSQNDTRQLIEVLEKAKAGELDDEKALAHVPESVKPIVAAAMRRDRSDLWLPILLFIVSLLLTWKMSSDSTNSTKQHIAASQAQIAQEISQEQEFDRCLQQIVSAALAETPAEGSTAPASAAGGQAAPKATPPKRAILPATSVPTPAVLPSKNEVCWCGSGRLFKRCHRTSTAGS
jgi:cytoskeletal protein RodZ